MQARRSRAMALCERDDRAACAAMRPAVCHMLLLAAVAWLAPLTAAAPGPGAASDDAVVYWVSTPVLAGDTVVVAGAGLDGAKVTLAGAGSACAAAAAAASGSTTAWAQAVKAVLPVGCGPPCNITIETASALRVVEINKPQVAWLMGGRSASGSRSGEPVAASAVSAGGVLRVFGRGLAWSGGEGTGSPWRCTSGRASSPTPSTRLVIHSASGGVPVEVEAAAANCFEATFHIPVDLAAGHWAAQLVTPWGVADLLLEITSAPAAKTVHVSVDNDHSGNVLAALQAAANATSYHGVSAIVHLGARAYRLSRNLTLPNRTTLLGMGSGATSLLFDLGGRPGHDWATHPYGTGPYPTQGAFNYVQLAAVNSAVAHSAIRDLSLVLRSPPWFPTAALWMPPGARYVLPNLR